MPSAAPIRPAEGYTAPYRGGGYPRTLAHRDLLPRVRKPSHTLRLLNFLPRCRG